MGWAFGGLKSLLIRMPSFRSKSDKPQRLAMDEFLSLVTAAGNWISCGHACEGSGALRRMTFTIHPKDGSSGGLTAVGSSVEQGESFEMDVSFSVPEGINEARLLIIGAMPVPVKFQPAEE